MDNINEFFINISNILWSMYIMVPILLVTSLYLGKKLKFPQIKNINKVFSSILNNDKDNSENGVNKFQTLTMSIGARVGTGNIVGITLSLVIGGAGSLFWMWIMAILGSLTAFAEAILGQLYKVEDSEYGYVGGPGFYLQNGLQKKKLAILYTLVLIFGYILAMVSLQSNTVANAFANLVEYNLRITSDFVPLIMGLVLGLVTYMVIIRGSQKMIDASSKIVTVMIICYLLVMLYVVFFNLEATIEAFKTIFTSAFSMKAILGGGIGHVIATGFKRGILSNEAGIGTAVHAGSTATVKHPLEVGYTQIFGVFIDTLFISTGSALVVLTTSISLDASTDPIMVFQMALQEHFGIFANYILVIALFFFAITTIIGTTYYGQAALKLFTKNEYKINIYKYVILILVIVSTVVSSELLWNLSDVATALLALINVYALLKLRDEVIECKNDYEDQEKNGKNPTYKNEKYEVWK